MANRVELFQVTVPAGTAKAGAQTTALDFNDGIVETIEIVVPDGVAGLAGFRIAKNGQSIIPYTGDNWIVSNDEKIIFPLTDLPEGAGWQLIAYNTDVFPHTFYLRFMVNDFGSTVETLAPQPALSIPPVLSVTQ